MNSENINNPHTEEEKEIKAFKEMMKGIEDGVGEALEGDDIEVANLTSANELITSLTEVLETEGSLTREEDSELRKMIMHLEQEQKNFPNMQEIRSVLAELRTLRRKSLEETA